MRLAVIFFLHDLWRGFGLRSFFLIELSVQRSFVLDKAINQHIPRFFHCLKHHSNAHEQGSVPRAFLYGSGEHFQMRSF